LMNAEKAYNAGEIDYMHYVNLLENAFTIKTTYLQNLYAYNLTVIEANYMLN